MSLLQWCDEGPATVELSATVDDAVRTMIDKTVGAVAVVDDQGVVAGMFTERDVLAKFALSGRDPKETLVRELMSPMVEMATEQTTPWKRLGSCWSGITVTCPSSMIMARCWASAPFVIFSKPASTTC